MHTQHAEPRGALRQLLTPLVVFSFQFLPRHHVRLRVASYESCRASRCTQATYESTLSPTHLMQQLLAFVHPLLKFLLPGSSRTDGKGRLAYACFLGPSTKRHPCGFVPGPRPPPPNKKKEKQTNKYVGFRPCCRARKKLQRYGYVFRSLNKRRRPRYASLGTREERWELQVKGRQPLNGDPESKDRMPRLVGNP